MYFFQTHKYILIIFVFAQFAIQTSLFADIKVGGIKLADPEHYCTIIKFLTVSRRNHSNVDFKACTDIIKVKALEDPIRREIFDKMKNAKEVFNFKTLKDAQTNFILRLNAIDHMSRMKTAENDNRPRVIDFWYHDGSWIGGDRVQVGSEKWEKGKPVQWRFKLKENENAYDGIIDLLKNKTRGECGGALVAAILGAAAKALGKPDFNKIHSDGSLYLYMREGFWKHVTSAKDMNTHIPGDWIYIKNKDDYTKRSKNNGVNGLWKGANTIYLGNKRYTCLGLPNLTINEIRVGMVAGYEKDTATNFLGPPATEIKIKWVKRLKAR